MKKFLVSCICCYFLIGTVCAQNFLRNLNKTLNMMDNTEIAGTQGTIPEGKNLRSVLYLLTTKESIEDKKVVGYDVKFESIDLLNDIYTIKSRVIFKNAITLTCQEGIVDITKNENGFLAKTKKFISYNCTSDGEKKSGAEVFTMQSKSYDALTQNICKEIQGLFDTCSEDEFKTADGMMLANLPEYCSISKRAGNKLKTKKWYNANKIDGLPVHMICMFAGIDESDLEGYAYKLKAGFYSNEMEVFTITLYSNNDAYIDLKEKADFEVKGTIKEVQFYDYSNIGGDYKVSKIVVVE